MKVQLRQLEVNQSYIPLLGDNARTQILYGGSSSGKSFFEAQRVVIDVAQHGRNYLVCRDVAKTLRQSVYNQITKIIDIMGLRSQFKITKSEMTITCKRNGRQILFAGLDDVEKLKSITPAVGVLTDAWIEEGTEVAYEAFKQINKRLRGLTGANLPKRVTITFNPITKAHWIYKEFFGNWDESKTQYHNENLSIYKTTYKDNAFLTLDDIAALENETDPYYHDVYTLGKWGVLGKVVFKNWRVEDISSVVASFDNIRNGLDFGFADDPNALVRLHIDTKRKRIYIFDEMYCTHMHDDELAEELHRRIGSQYITCDSAEPKSIHDLARRDIRAIGAVKGADSIRYGIRFLQGFEIVIDVSCKHFKKEIEQYQWAEDKYGNTLSRPVDKNNHLLDALRYAVEDLMLQNKGVAARRL